MNNYFQSLDSCLSRPREIRLVQNKEKLTCQSYEDINHFLLGFFFVCVSNTFSLRFWHFCWKLCPHAFHFNVTAGFPSLKPVHWAHLSCTLRMACATIKQLFDHWAVNLARAKDALAWNNLLLASYPWSWQFTKERSLLECCKLFNSFKFNKKVKLFCTLKTCIIKFRI